MPIGSQYLFHAHADGYVFNSLNFEPKESSFNKTYEIEILLDRLEVGKSVNLQNIFFETNSYQLSNSSTIELNLLIDLLNENESLTIEIAGHTDNVGDAKLNQKLSENRAKAVYIYLIANGIAQKRLTYKGYGTTEPKATNETEQGKQQNRRTEFTIKTL